MSSPLFEWTSGVQTFGEYEFEWLPLQKTPCFGVNGPNACYSSACDHNPTQKGSKYLKSTKTIVNRFPIQNDNLSIRSLSPYDTPSECSSPEYYACDAKFSPVYYMQGLTKPLYINIEQSPIKCNNGLNNCPMIEELSPMHKQILGTLTSHQQNIDKLRDLSCDKCASRFDKQRLYRRGSEFELPQLNLQLNPESKPFDPSTPWQWQSNEQTKENMYPFNGLAGEWECDCYWKLFKSEYFKTELVNDAEEHHTLIINSNNDPNEKKQAKRSFECILCPKRFRTFNELQGHYRDKIEKPYDCSCCNAMFKHKYLLWRHRNIHRSLTLHECRGCKKSFRSLLMLKKHIEECRYKLYMLTESEI